MSNTQYTIRNVPPDVDSVLRLRAKKNKQSFNKTLVEALRQSTASTKKAPAKGGFDWFYGSGMDDDTLRALEQDAELQKELAKKELLDAS